MGVRGTHLKMQSWIIHLRGQKLQYWCKQFLSLHSLSPLSIAVCSLSLVWNGVYTVLSALYSIFPVWTHSDRSSARSHDQITEPWHECLCVCAPEGHNLARYQPDKANAEVLRAIKIMTIHGLWNPHIFFPKSPGNYRRYVCLDGAQGSKRMFMRCCLWICF